MLIIIDNFYTALFSGVHKLTVLYNILQQFLSEKKLKGNMFTLSRMLQVTATL